MPGDIDPLADAFIDGLMAEREEAEAKARERRAQEESEKVSELDERLADRPVPKSALFRLIEEKGELTDEDLHKLVAREVRKGI